MKDFKELQKELKESESKIKNIEFTSVELLKTIFDITNRQRNLINEILKPNKCPSNKCPYCKENDTDSIDHNILCLDCRETFGHSFLMNYRNGDVVC